MALTPDETAELEGILREMGLIPDGAEAVEPPVSLPGAGTGPTVEQSVAWGQALDAFQLACDQGRDTLIAQGCPEHVAALLSRNITLLIMSQMLDGES